MAVGDRTKRGRTRVGRPCGAPGFPRTPGSGRPSGQPGVDGGQQRAVGIRRRLVGTEAPTVHSVRSDEHLGPHRAPAVERRGGRSGSGTPRQPPGGRPGRWPAGRGATLDRSCHSGLSKKLRSWTVTTDGTDGALGHRVVGSVVDRRVGVGQRARAEPRAVPRPARSGRSGSGSVPRRCPGPPARSGRRSERRLNSTRSTSARSASGLGQLQDVVTGTDRSVRNHARRRRARRSTARSAGSAHVPPSSSATGPTRHGGVGDRRPREFGALDAEPFATRSTLVASSVATRRSPAAIESGVVRVDLDRPPPRCSATGWPRPACRRPWPRPGEDRTPR